MNTTSERQYLSCAETAKLLRASLKRNFPAVKFSVRSSVYSGGASVRVDWTNGPRQSAVQAVCDRFNGADFDGMQDLKTYHDTVLTDEQGNTRSVHFGADFIFANRHESPEVATAVIERLRAKFSPDEKCPDYEWERRAWRGVLQIDIPAGEPVSVTADRAVVAYFTSIGD